MMAGGEDYSDRGSDGLGGGGGGVVAEEEDWGRKSGKTMAEQNCVHASSHRSLRLSTSIDLRPQTALNSGHLSRCQPD